MKNPKNPKSPTNKNPKQPTNNPDSTFDLLAAPFLSHPKFLKMKNFRQHALTSTYEHCISVAKLSYKLNKNLHLGADEKDLVAAALLHDFYLYDWHDPNNPTKKHPKKLKTAHAFSHAETARKNAVKYFHINKKVQFAIKSHMWPLNITRFPKTRVAFLVQLSDKICTLRELFHR